MNNEIIKHAEVIKALHNVEGYREKISEFDEQIKLLENEKNSYIDSVVSKCTHPIEYIVKHVNYTTFSSFDFRVCKLCGLQENYPHRILRGYSNSLPNVSFDDAMKIRLKRSE